MSQTELTNAQTALMRRTELVQVLENNEPSPLVRQSLLTALDEIDSSLARAEATLGLIAQRVRDQQRLDGYTYGRFSNTKRVSLWGKLCGLFRRVTSDHEERV
jgi:hypothetical protein